MDDLPARLRQGVLRQDAIYLDDGIDVPATEALMTDAADEIERQRKIEALARAVCEAIPAWAEELLEIHPLASLRKLVETNDD